MWIRYQPNPKTDRVGDCTVRALSHVLGKTWDQTYALLAVYGFIRKDMPSGNDTWDMMLRDFGFTKHIIHEQCFDGCYTVRDFCKDHPYGSYLLGTGSHAIAVKDGNYMDAWDSGNEYPIYYYRKGN